MRLSFGKSFKLVKNEYELVFNQGKKFHTPYFSCFYYPAPEGASAKIGILAGKKNIPLAVRRQYLKRIIREQFRLQQMTLKPMWLIFIVKREAKAADNKLLHQDLQQILQKFACGN